MKHWCERRKLSSWAPTYWSAAVDALLPHPFLMWISTISNIFAKLFIYLHFQDVSETFNQKKIITILEKSYHWHDIESNRTHSLRTNHEIFCPRVRLLSFALHLNARLAMEKLASFNSLRNPNVSHLHSHENGNLKYLSIVRVIVSRFREHMLSVSACGAAFVWNLDLSTCWISTEIFVARRHWTQKHPLIHTHTCSHFSNSKYKQHRNGCTAARTAFINVSNVQYIYLAEVFAHTKCNVSIIRRNNNTFVFVSTTPPLALWLTQHSSCTWR